MIIDTNTITVVLVNMGESMIETQLIGTNMVGEVPCIERTAKNCCFQRPNQNPVQPKMSRQLPYDHDHDQTVMAVGLCTFVGICHRNKPYQH